MYVYIMRMLIMLIFSHCEEMWSSERVMYKHVRKHRCIIHLSFTRKIRSNLRGNSSDSWSYNSREFRIK